MYQTTIMTIFIIIIESHHVINENSEFTNNKLIELSNIDQKQPHHNEEIKIFREKKPRNCNL